MSTISTTATMATVQARDQAASVLVGLMGGSCMNDKASQGSRRPHGSPELAVLLLRWWAGGDGVLTLGHLRPRHVPLVFPRLLGASHEGIELLAG